MVFPGSWTGTAWADRDWELFYACCKNAREAGQLLRSLAQPIGILCKKERGLEIALGMRVNGKTIRHV